MEEAVEDSTEGLRGWKKRRVRSGGTKFMGQSALAR